MRRYLWFFISLVLLGVGFYGVNRSQDISDWLKLRNYQPSPAIEALALNSSMNDLGKKLFYVNDPELIGKPNFATYCTVGEETIVLGCYISSHKIYLFDVTEDRLEGVEEVTAAHEMLHAAYDRLSVEEKDRVNKLLEQEYEKITDKRLLETIESYRKRDPNIVNNELHSILATEVRNLSKDLEEYYSRYFDNRLAVVELSEKYENEFNILEEQIANYDKQLESLQGEITRIEADLKRQLDNLNNERKRIENLRSSPEAYNQEVAGYNALVERYNNDVNRVRDLINQFNTLVEERNKIAVEERELVEAVDSRVQTLD